MRKFRITATIVAIFSMSGITGQTTVPGTESPALGGISVVLENPWSVAGNPAGLAGFNHFTVNTSLEERFLLKSLNEYAFALSLPAWKGTMGTCIEFFGYHGFIKLMATLGYGMKFSNAFRAGIGLFYVYQQAGNESPAVHQVSFSMGTAVIISDRLTFAFSAFNPFNLYFKSAAYSSLPAVFRLGMAYRPSGSFAILAEIEKTLDYPLIWKIGCTCNAGDKFYVSGGIRLFPACFSLGAGYRVRRLMIGLASSYHQYLGFTPSTSIQYLIK